ncbi:MAG: adenosylcobalamin-dependent ribonucleoside-diphosphate reductase [Planctomycetes bacterium]|nr:adenosylcobalamin-dependent ribonucleoside-diphosphate reductase [Planctomycetota bacterium]MBL7146551.1 adenosylcobalamin-dependent ribonucleoside-diphosphate reductase [Phycisphaerae bacterium]
MAELHIYPPPGNAPVLSENALTVLRSRYLIKNQDGKCIETPAQLFSRVASLIAEAEGKYGADESKIRQWHRKFYDVMASLKFLPNSPALMNARRRTMLSACFVLPIEDSIEGIFETIKQTALIQQAGGGTGFSFDKLRPAGDRVASSGGTTSGPISFWRVLSETTNAIQQGAFRRGANMGMMGVEHPDILKFLHAKQNLDAFTNFNISVKITDDWMKKVLKSGKSLHTVINPRNQQSYLLPRQIDITNYTLNDLHKLTGKGRPGSKPAGQYFTVSDIWKMIIKCAHTTGEPGVVFIDRINRDNPTPSLGRIEATNPCGEQPLLPYEACTLGSINLTKFVNVSNGKTEMDWPALARTVRLAVRFLDNIIDVCEYPVRDTIRLSQGNRKIGLGVMGFADCLFLLGIPYDSKQGIDFASEIMGFINKSARKASSELADLRGPFPNWNSSIWRTKRKKKVRNASITCVAPTGTISIIADCSSGIEPVYSPVFVRQILNGSKLLQINPFFKQVAESHGFYNKKLENQIAKTGSIQKIPQIPPAIRRIFKSAYDINPQWHIRMQSAFQQHCDAAVSKTINFSEKATVASVDKAYKLAYRLGCKGITIYRRHSRDREPMSLFY